MDEFEDFVSIVSIFLLNVWQSLNVLKKKKVRNNVYKPVGKVVSF